MRIVEAYVPKICQCAQFKHQSAAHLCCALRWESRRIAGINQRLMLQWAVEMMNDLHTQNPRTFGAVAPDFTGSPVQQQH